MRRALDRTLAAAALACVLLSVGLLVALLTTIAVRGWPALDLAFLSEGMRRGGAAGGILHNLLGTLLLILTAAVVCTPLALALALTHGFYLRPGATRRRLELLLYALNGMPSILIGILGLVVFVGGLGWGKSWLGGGILLAWVMLPTVALSMIERIGALPRRYIEAAVGLGLSDSQVVRAVILPQSLGALVTGLLLGLARVAGETAPILFTATVFAGAGLPSGIRESPVQSLPYHIFVLAQDSLDPDVARNVWGSAAVLVGLVIGLAALALPLRLRLHEEARRG